MSKPDYQLLYSALRKSALAGWETSLEKQIQTKLFDSNDGHLDRWMDALEKLPKIESHKAEIINAVRFDGACEIESVEELLKVFHPWRKGPINLGGVNINTEWRSDWKWDRLKNHITSLDGRTVLDVGCGNGYFLYRMVGAGAKLAIGVDPFLLFVMQYWAIKHFAPELPAWVLPIGWEDLPSELPHFDTVFSMGVLYHRRNPHSFLQNLKNYIRPGGELVLETLVIDGSDRDVLVPEGRYAKMRNVWYIPSVETLKNELRNAGWEHVRCVDVSPTTTDEQRSTDWMQFESLSDYLDPDDPTKTVEGYPSPVRAILLACKSE